MDTFLGGPYNKDYSMLGSVLGSPLSAEITISACSKFWILLRDVDNEHSHCRGAQVD